MRVQIYKVPECPKRHQWYQILTGRGRVVCSIPAGPRAGREARLIYRLLRKVGGDAAAMKGE